MWTKYSYVCTICDALIEITTQVSPEENAHCTCSRGAWVTRTAQEPMVQPNVISFTSKGVVKINTNPYTL
jgi:hypothetical protein